MFNLFGFFKSLGIVLLVFIGVSFFIGIFKINHVALSLILMYGSSYVLIGVLAPLSNRKTPYFASYLSSITLTVLNFLFAMFMMDILVFADPVEINRGLVWNSLISLVTTSIVLQIVKRREAL